MRRLCLLATVVIAGCMSWQSPRNVQEQLRAPAASGTRARVTTAAGQWMMDSVTIRGDSLAGLRTDSGAARLAIVPLAEVSRIEVRRVSTGRTVALIGGVAAVAVVVVAGAIAVSNLNDDWFAGDDHPSASCPFVYSWDGARWRLDSGTFGGAISGGLERTDLDNLEHAVARHGHLRLRVANELPETDHVNMIEVVVVDAAPGTITAPDPEGGMHAFRDLTAPASATDFRGADALARVGALDGWSWISSPSNRDSARSRDVRDGVQLAFARPAGSTEAHLVVDGNNTLWATYLLKEWVSAHAGATRAWYDSLDADRDFARRAFAPLAREGFLTVSVLRGATWTAAGQYWEAGPEMRKRQVLHLDLDGVLGDTLHIRLESAPSFWLIDHVSVAYGADEVISTQTIPPASARLSSGRDVRNALLAADTAYLTLETGESAELTFAVPPALAPAERSYLLRSRGWYRIRTSEQGEPAVAFLDRLAGEPLAVSKTAVGKLNAALAEQAGP
jgi:hypothetical protein